MQSKVASKNIVNEVMFVQDIMSQFFCDVCKIDNKKKKELNKVFNGVYVGYSKELLTLGEANYTGQYILINKKIMNDKKEVISCLVHEYTHMLVNRQSKKKAVIPNFFAEGVADAVAELVINWYFSKHPSVVVGDKVISYDLPYCIDSKYVEEDSYVKTMLCVLADKGKLKSSLSELVLGDLHVFFQNLLGKEAAKNSIVVNKKIIENINVDCFDFYYDNIDKFKDLDIDNVFALRNRTLLLFKLCAKYDLDMFSLKNGIKKEYDCYEIHHLIFKKRKIYEIDPKEYEEFVYLYDNARLNKRSVFGENAWRKYSKFCLSSLSGDEIVEHSGVILRNVIYFIASKDCFRVDNGYANYFEYFLKVELRKIKDNNLSDEYISKLKREVLYEIDRNLNRFSPSEGSNKLKKVVAFGINELDDFMTQRRNKLNVKKSKV